MRPRIGSFTPSDRMKPIADRAQGGQYGIGKRYRTRVGMQIAHVGDVEPMGKTYQMLSVA